MKRILVLGGAGFIGSNIAEGFVNNGDKVVIVDGLLAKTGGDKKNIEGFKDKIEFIESSIENINDLEALLDETDLIIDSMAWTSHHAAILDPIYDLELNCRSHLYLIKNLRTFKGKKVMYLSSRGVYGNPGATSISEESETIPVDVQGIHKLTGEHYYRVFSKFFDLNTIVLRIPNCFGNNQPVKGEDIGLIGSFIRDSLQDKKIEVYGNKRKRAFLFVNDLVNAIIELSYKDWKGYMVYNAVGFEKSIYDLALEITSIVKRGKVILKDIPKKIEEIDAGNASINDEKLKGFIGQYVLSSSHNALEQTIVYFKEKLA